MKTISMKLGIALTFIFLLIISTAPVGDAKDPVAPGKLQAIFIMTPKTGDTVTSPVKICIESLGVELESASNGNNEGKGHHHIIVDMPLPAEIAEVTKESEAAGLGTSLKGMGRLRVIKEDHNHIHWSDGSDCGRVDLRPGKRVIRSLFSYGNHVPFYPILSDSILITVK